MSRTNDEQHSIDVRVDTIMNKVKINDTVNITLSMRQWNALATIAEHNEVSVDRVVQRWVCNRILTLSMSSIDDDPDDE